jgi:hypothetical protein
MPTEPDARWYISFEPAQICPAQPGWRAVWKNAEGNYFRAPVAQQTTGQRVSTPSEKAYVNGAVCWAPKPKEAEREPAAFGLVVIDGYLECPETAEDFIGYAGPGEPLE